MSEITYKGKVGQFLCRHKNKGWYIEEKTSGLTSISGEKRLYVCRNCGKVLDKQFARYEGMGFK